MTTEDLLSLQAGKPPTSDDLIKSLTVDNSWLESMTSHCLGRVIDKGGCKVKIIYGGQGSGKSHYLRYLRSYAMHHGYLVTLFDLQRLDFKITELVHLYTAIVGCIDLNRIKKYLLDAILKQLGYDYNKFETFHGSLVDFLKENEDAPIYEGQRSIRKCIYQMAQRIDISFSFRLFLVRYMKALADNDDKTIDITERWLKGLKLEPFEKKQCQLFERLNKQNARVWLYSLSEFLKLGGYKGLIILFDQFESILPEFNMAVKYSNAKRNDVYEMFRQLIDDLDMLQNFMLLIAGNSQIIHSERFGLRSYEALWMRIRQSYTQSYMFNPYTDLVDADLLMQQIADSGGIDKLVQRINEIYAEDGGFIVDHSVHPSVKRNFSDIVRYYSQRYI